MKLYQSLGWFVLLCRCAEGLTASWDGAASSSITLTVEAELAPAAKAVTEISTLFAIGQYRANVSSAEDEEMKQLFRKALFAKANGGVGSVLWLGVGLEAHAQSQ